MAHRDSLCPDCLEFECECRPDMLDAPIDVVEDLVAGWNMAVAGAVTGCGHRMQITAMDQVKVVLLEEGRVGFVKCAECRDWVRLHPRS